MRSKRELRRNLESNMSGKLKPVLSVKSTTINMILSPRYTSFVLAILNALVSYKVLKLQNLRLRKELRNSCETWERN